METTTFISNILVIVMVPICTAVLWWRQYRYIKQLKAIVKEFNDAITEAVSVRDEIQSLFDDFEEKLDAENDKKKEKVMNGKILTKELVDSYIKYFEDVKNQPN